MNKILLILAISTALLSCNSDDNNLQALGACNVYNPNENLDWLKAQVQVLEDNTSDISKYFFIEIAEYQNQTVFISNNCCHVCNTIIPVYNCEGNVLGRIYQDIGIDEVTNSKIIYKPADFACQTNDNTK